MIKAKQKKPFFFNFSKFVFSIFGPWEKIKKQNLRKIKSLVYSPY